MRRVDFVEWRECTSSHVTEALYLHVLGDLAVYCQSCLLSPVGLLPWMDAHLHQEIPK